MSGSRDPESADGAKGTEDLARTALLETTHADAAAAQTVAAALTPDNTPEIATTAEGATVRTRVERETTGGLLATVDDYLVNLGVADDAVAMGRGNDGTNDAGGTRDTADTRTSAGTRDTADTRDTAKSRDAANEDDTHDT